MEMCWTHCVVIRIFRKLHWVWRRIIFSTFINFAITFFQAVLVCCFLKEGMLHKQANKHLFYCHKWKYLYGKYCPGHALNKRGSDCRNVTRLMRLCYSRFVNKNKKFLETNGYDLVYCSALLIIFPGANMNSP